MTKPKESPNKFESLSREDLIASLLEMEDELVKLRPKPAKFKLGQVLSRTGPNNLPTQYFVVLSVENRLGKWCYGYSKQPGAPGAFHVFPEDKCRALNATEIDGTPLPAEQVAAMEASAPPAGVSVSTPAHYVPHIVVDSEGILL